MESKYGIPTVAVHVHVFARLVDSTARTNGMPRARQAFVPAPMFNQPPAGLRGYIEGAAAGHGGPGSGELPATADRAGHGGQPGAAFPGEPLDGLPADRAADGGAGGGDAGGGEPGARRGGGGGAAHERGGGPGGER